MFLSKNVGVEVCDDLLAVLCDIEISDRFPNKWEDTIPIKTGISSADPACLAMVPN